MGGGGEGEGGGEGGGGRGGGRGSLSGALSGTQAGNLGETTDSERHSLWTDSERHSLWTNSVLDSFSGFFNLEIQTRDRKTKSFNHNLLTLHSFFIFTASRHSLTKAQL